MRILEKDPRYLAVGSYITVLLLLLMIAVTAITRSHSAPCRTNRGGDCCSTPAR